MSDENKKSDEDLIQWEGTITQVYQGGNFEVEITENDKTFKLKAHLAGKLRRHRIRVVLGDKVTVEVSHHDMSNGRIMFRHK